MSVDMAIVKQEARTDSPGPPEDVTHKKNNHSKSFEVNTEFVHIKEEIEEWNPSGLTIKLEPLDEDANLLPNSGKPYPRNDIKIEFSPQDPPIESRKPEKESLEDNKEIGIMLNPSSMLNLTPESKENLGNDLPNGFENGYLNGMLEKKFDEGRYAKELHSTFSNYFVSVEDTNIFNPMMNALTNNVQQGISNETRKKGSKETKSKGKVQNASKKKHKLNGVLEKLYRESLKKDLMKNGKNIEGVVEDSATENKTLFDGKNKIVDIVSTPELKEESFYNDSDSGGSNPMLQVFTIREGFPLPEFNLEDRDCPICHEVFSSPANMQRHFHIHTKNSNYECKICNIKFWRRQEMTKHMYRHDLREFECEICHRMFKSKSNLNQHIKCHTERFNCVICEKSYPTKALYEKHMNRKLCRRKGALLRCPICFKGFKYECSLKCHVRRHSPDRPYICDLCGMDFETKREIVNHINYHTRARPFKCNVCPKRFANMAFRRAHMRIHTGEKPYKCPLCERHFTHKHNMERHTEGHAKEKKLICDICGRKFPRESRLVYHMRSHFDRRPFACEACPKKFAHKQNVLKHYQRSHPGSVYSNRETDASVAYKTWREIQNKLITMPEEESEQILG